MHDQHSQARLVTRGFTLKRKRDSLHGNRDHPVLEAMIGVGHRLGLTVTIEGVEHEESVDWLARNGCDVVQGFVFSRPLEASVAREWVTRYGPDQSPAPAQTVSAAPLRL